MLWIVIPNDVLAYTDPHCDMHYNCLCLSHCADRAIPKIGGRWCLDRWDKKVWSIRDGSILRHKIWQKSGCPSSGILIQLKKCAKSRYKYAVRRLIRSQDMLRAWKMADALFATKAIDFWLEVKWWKPGKRSVPPMIDDVHGGDYIAKMGDLNLESSFLLLILILHLAWLQLHPCFGLIQMIVSPSVLF